MAASVAHRFSALPYVREMLVAVLREARVAGGRWAGREYEPLTAARAGREAEAEVGTGAWVGDEGEMLSEARH